jgi:hypothetical protein
MGRTFARAAALAPEPELADAFATGADRLLTEGVGRLAAEVEGVG